MVGRILEPVMQIRVEERTIVFTSVQQRPAPSSSSEEHKSVERSDNLLDGAGNIENRHEILRRRSDALHYTKAQM